MKRFGIGALAALAAAALTTPPAAAADLPKLRSR